ncbi:MAG: asparagine synthase C-terminal domain-containing protein [Candidatus Colwellbacteria bacterium]|jgi:hypothetical protein|nr:asparagine synthase C-terminal domain-containing protein [Candidatus Colwellbacteria bacterium]
MIKESYYLATRQFNPFYSPSRTLLKTEDEIIDFVKNNLPNGKVGILLSSGRDSCSLAAMLPKDTIAYTVKFLEKGIADESPFAKKIADRLGIRHKTVIVTKEDYDKYTDELIKFKGEPLLPIEPTIYKLALAAKEDGIEVLATGTLSSGKFSCHIKAAEKYKKDGNIDQLIKGNNGHYNPTDYLKGGIPFRQLFGKYITKNVNGNETMDAERFIDEISFGNYWGDYYPISAAGLIPYIPYATIDYAVDRDKYLEDRKYPILNLYKRFYGEDPKKKIAFERPLRIWLKDYKPTHKNFIKNINIDNLSGSGRWLFYCLERYWDLYK